MYRVAARENGIAIVIHKVTYWARFRAQLRNVAAVALLSGIAFGLIAMVGVAISSWEGVVASRSTWFQGELILFAGLWCTFVFVALLRAFVLAGSYNPNEMLLPRSLFFTAEDIT